MRRTVALAASLIVYAVITSFPASAMAGSMRMVALDVGEGQAVLFAKDGHGLLVDAGPPHRAAELVRDIKDIGVNHLDCLILTHLHPDHTGGLFRILEEWPGMRIIENGHRPPANRMPDLSRWAGQVLEKHQNVDVVGAGDRVFWQGAQIDFIWPKKIRDHNLNRNSLVLILSHAGERVLIMGDVGTGVERVLLRQEVFERELEIKALVAGHHGSKNSSSSDFLQRISPQHAIICIDRNNIRGYPNQNTVNRLERYSEHVHRSWNGDVMISVGSGHNQKETTTSDPVHGNRQRKQGMKQ